MTVLSLELFLGLVIYAGARSRGGRAFGVFLALGAAAALITEAVMPR
ncbi:hypothetical protein ABZ820_12705 [Streptomyces diacarni]